MEKNRQQDDFGEFLKKSFESYHDSPSGGLWDKIEAGLPDQQATVSSRRPFPIFWFVLTGILLLIIVAQFINYHRELDHLSNKVEQQEQEIKSREGNLPDDNQDFENQEAGHPGSLAVPEMPIGQDIPQAAIQSKQAGPAGQKREWVKDHTIESGNDSQDRNTAYVPFPPEPNEDLPHFVQDQMADNPSEITTPPAMAFAAERLPVPDFTLDAASFAPRWQPVRLSPAPIEIDPVSPVRKTSVGVRIQRLNVRERVVSSVQRPFSGRRVMEERGPVTGSGLLAGLSVNRDLGKGWLLESGLAYRRTELSATHNPQLRFLDRIRENVGPLNREHDFAYLLNTPSGSVEIEFRAEQSEPQLPVNENEVVEIEIQTRHTVHQLSLPLLLGYRFAFGQWGVEIKSGLMANILAGQTYEITRIDFLNSRFRNSGSRRPVNSKPSLQELSWDFVAGAGFYYRPAGNWEFQVSPVLIRSLGSLHNDRYLESASTSIGWQAGLAWKF